MKSVPTLAPAARLRPDTGAWSAVRLLGAELAAVLRRSLAGPRRRLDIRTLSDHLKRDIGALDGNDPRGPRP